jgi:hypothetical protein
MMVRFIFTFTFFLTLLTAFGFAGDDNNTSELVSLNVPEQDTLHEIQILYNGRLWRNRYYRVKEDQFLFSRDFLPGSITIGGKTFKNLSVRYDIYTDEIMTVTNHGTILQMNKEMVDSFNIIYQNKSYNFANIQDDRLKGFRGYINVLFKGKVALYVKYKKEIELLAVEKKYDLFYQTHRIYFVKDDLVYQINSKREFFKLLDDQKLQIRTFIKINRLKVSKKVPESFVPVVELYDSLSH